MKLLTLNTHSWMEENPEQKLQQLAEKIGEEQYEIIALQEVNQLLESNAAPVDAFFHPVEEQWPIHEDNFAYRLVELLKENGHHYHWSWSESHLGYDRFAEGAAILSKTAISPESLLVSTANNFHDYHTRRILAGKTKIQNQEVLVLSCHYSWWEAGFPYEWQQTMEYLNGKNLPLLLMGDFNNAADREGEGYDHLLESAPYLNDAYTVADKRNGIYTVEKSIDGWEGNADQLRIDYVFLTSHFQVATYQVTFDGINAPVVSDHYGVEVELTVEK